MRIAIIGAGISGLAAAHYLSDGPPKSITVFEAEEVFGGRASVTDKGGEHCTRLFLPDYHYLLALLGEVPFGDRTVRDVLEPSRRFARTRRGSWLEIDHIYAFLAKTPGLSLTDKWDISKANRQSLLVAKRAQTEARRQALSAARGRSEERDAAALANAMDPAESLNVFAPIWNWSARSLARAVRSARGSNVTYALPGDTDRHLTAPWVAHLRSRGVVFHANARAETIAVVDDEVEVVVGERPERFDIVLVTAFPTDSYALLDRSAIPRPLDHRSHTHCKCFTIDLDPREEIAGIPGTRIFSHGGMTTVVQPDACRCVTLATFPASTHQQKIVGELRKQLSLAYEPLRIRCRANLATNEAVFVGTYVDPVALAEPLAPRVYFAGSATANSYAVDSGEGACRSAYQAATRIAADHDIAVRGNDGLPSPGPHGGAPPQSPRAHPNALARPRRAAHLWRAACAASALVAKGPADLSFVDASGCTWPLGQPAIYVANHRSVFDVPAGLLTFRFLHVFPRLVVARKYFDGPSSLGLKAVGAFPALRGTSATISAAIAALRQGESVAFMVEGAITGLADAEKAMHGRGAAEAAVATSVPVIPIGAWGTGDVWPKPRPWPAVRLRRPPVVITIGAPIWPDESGVESLMERVRASMRELELAGGRRAGAVNTGAPDADAEHPKQPA